MNIIDGLQKRGARIIEKLITAIGWFVMLGYIFQIILSLVLWIFNISNFYQKLFLVDDLYKTIRTFLITIIISASAFLFLYFWGKYNYKKFGQLNRRKFPEAVKNSEISDFFHIEASLVEKMQNEDIIVLEDNII